MMLKTFLQSYKKQLPKLYTKFLQTLQSQSGLIIHQPIIAQPANHPVKIKIRSAIQTIQEGVGIFWVSSAQSFTSEELVGASAKDKMQVEKFFEDFGGRSQLLRNEETKGIFKMLIQIYANHMELDSGKMPSYDLADILINQSNDPKLMQQLGLIYDLSKNQKQIKSLHLRNILNSSQNSRKDYYNIFTKNFIKVAGETQFQHLVRLIRAQARSVNQHSLLLKQRQQRQRIQLTKQMPKINVISPILSSLRPSADSNCDIIGKYFTHTRQSYYCVQATRQIKGGQQLTIPQKPTNNYQKFMRQGYKSVLQHPQNPNNEYILIINLVNPQIEEVQQIMAGDVQTKMHLLAANNLKMKPIIKINKKGQIIPEDLMMLRILFGALEDGMLVKPLFSIQQDKKIYGFVAKFVEATIQQQERYSQNVGATGGKVENQQLVKSFRIIEDDQSEILNKFMALWKQHDK